MRTCEGELVRRYSNYHLDVVKEKKTCHVNGSNTIFYDLIIHCSLQLLLGFLPQALEAASELQLLRCVLAQAHEQPVLLFVLRRLRVRRLFVQYCECLRVIVRGMEQELTASLTTHLRLLQQLLHILR